MKDYLFSLFMMYVVCDVVEDCDVTLSESEAHGTLIDGLEELLAEFVVIFVHRQVQLIETSMSTGQSVCGPVIHGNLE